MWHRLISPIGAFLLVCLTAADLVKNPDQISWRILRATVLTTRENRPVLMIVTAACVLFATFISLRLEKRGHNRKVIKAVLDTLHEEYFAEVPKEQKHRHRVTLFRCVRLPSRLWARRGLVVYVRAGRHGRSRTTFLVGEHENECEGVAGRIWYISAEMTRRVPEWPEGPGDQAGQEAYAREGFLSVEKCRALNVKSRAFAGSVVRVGGENWGVLLIDSVSPGPVTQTKEPIIGRYAGLLGKMLS